MTNPTFKSIVKAGLWDNNPALVQLLGLCPLLAVSATVVNALGLGLATIVVLAGSNFVISAMRNHVNDVIRLPTFVMVIAALTTCIELLMQAFTYELYQILGIFIPLIVTNCTILGRADGFARQNPPRHSLIDGLAMGVGFTLALLILGGIRELIGTGGIFDQMELIFGPSATHWHLQLTETDFSFVVALLPPGAFIALGFMIAAKKWFDARLEQRANQHQHRQITGAKRVRVTGKIN